MIVRADASIRGTVGGGSGERDVIVAAADVLARGGPRMFPVEMWADAEASEGMVCGGRMDVWIERVDPAPARDGRWIRILADRHASGQVSVLVRRFSGTTVDAGTGAPPDANSGITSVEDAAERPLWSAASGGGGLARPGPRTDSASDHRERVEPARRLVIVGAGHIGLALARLTGTLGYDVTVVDDRPAADLDTVPGTDARYGADCGEVLAESSYPPGTDYALLSRGWRADVGALRSILACRPGYVGMVGSRRRVETVFRTLESEGVARADLAFIDAPIGIDIGAETPEEIAVSIASALIAHRRISRG